MTLKFKDLTVKYTMSGTLKDGGGDTNINLTLTPLLRWITYPSKSIKENVLL